MEHFLAALGTPRQKGDLGLPGPEVSAKPGVGKEGLSSLEIREVFGINKS